MKTNDYEDRLVGVIDEFNARIKATIKANAEGRKLGSNIKIERCGDKLGVYTKDWLWVLLTEGEVADMTADKLTTLLSHALATVKVLEYERSNTFGDAKQFMMRKIEKLLYGGD